MRIAVLSIAIFQILTYQIISSQIVSFQNDLSLAKLIKTAFRDIRIIIYGVRPKTINVIVLFKDTSILII
jgi:hypothetical protein